MSRTVTFFFFVRNGPKLILAAKIEGRRWSVSRGLAWDVGA